MPPFRCAFVPNRSARRQVCPGQTSCGLSNSFRSYRRAAKRWSKFAPDKLSNMGAVKWSGARAACLFDPCEISQWLSVRTAAKRVASQ